MPKKNTTSDCVCPYCIDDSKEVKLVPTGKVMFSNPMKREYKCQLCGYKKIIADQE